VPEGNVEILLDLADADPLDQALTHLPQSALRDLAAPWGSQRG
jgi:hypothetical protein